MISLNAGSSTKTVGNSLYFWGTMIETRKETWSETEENWILFFLITRLVIICRVSESSENSRQPQGKISYEFYWNSMMETWDSGSAVKRSEEPVEKESSQEQKESGYNLRTRTMREGAYVMDDDVNTHYCEKSFVFSQPETFSTGPSTFGSSNGSCNGERDEPMKWTFSLGKMETRHFKLHLGHQCTVGRRRWWNWDPICVSQSLRSVEKLIGILHSATECCH